MMKGWISSNKRRIEGLYKDSFKVRIPRKVRELMKKRAAQKGMNLSEYVRFLIHKDLEEAFKENERTNP
jgi:predicted DNA binding CopG/RHH family protein